MKLKPGIEFSVFLWVLLSLAASATVHAVSQEQDHHPVSGVMAQVDAPDIEQIEALLNQGSEYEQQQQFVKAEQSYRKALAILVQWQGASSELNVAVRLRLGALFLDLDRNGEALGALLEARQWLGQLQDNSKQSVDLDYYLAMGFSRVGENEAAEQLFHTVIERLEARGEEQGPVMAKVLNNLGTHYRRTNRLVEAEAMLHRSLELAARNGAVDTPDIAVSISNLAGIQILLGKTQMAEANFRRAIDIMEQNYGPEHSMTARSHGYLGIFLIQRQRWGEALQELERATATLVRRAKQQQGSAHAYDEIRQNRVIFKSYFRALQALPLAQDDRQEQILDILKILMAAGNGPAITQEWRNRVYYSRLDQGLLVWRFDEEDGYFRTEPLSPWALAQTGASTGCALQQEVTAWMPESDRDLQFVALFGERTENAPLDCQ